MRFRPSSSTSPARTCGLPMGEFDGVAQVWFDSLEARAHAAASAEGKRWHADGGTIIGGIRSFVTRERFVVPVPSNRPTFKTLSVIKRKPELSAKEFHHEWAVVHAPMARAVPGLRGFTLYQIVRRTVSSGHRTVFARRPARRFYRELVGQPGIACADGRFGRRQGVVRPWLDFHWPCPQHPAAGARDRAGAGGGRLRFDEESHHVRSGQSHRRRRQRARPLVRAAGQACAEPRPPT